MDVAGGARYTAVAIGLHWLLAVLIATAFCMGLVMTELPLSPARIRLYNWHKWIGITVLGLSAVRWGWRLRHPPPALPARIVATMPRWQRGCWRATHAGLYLLFFAVPLAGWVYSSALGFPVVWFGVVPLPDLVAPNKLLADELLRSLHVALAFTLAAAVLVHVAGALKHHWIDRDGLLARMWPGRRKEVS